MTKYRQRLSFKREFEVAFNWFVKQKIKDERNLVNFKSSEDSTLII